MWRKKKSFKLIRRLSRAAAAPFIMTLSYTFVLPPAGGGGVSNTEYLNRLLKPWTGSQSTSILGGYWTKTRLNLRLSCNFKAALFMRQRQHFWIFWRKWTVKVIVFIPLKPNNNHHQLVADLSDPEDYIPAAGRQKNLQFPKENWFVFTFYGQTRHSSSSAT